MNMIMNPILNKRIVVHYGKRKAGKYRRKNFKTGRGEECGDSDKTVRRKVGDRCHKNGGIGQNIRREERHGCEISVRRRKNCGIGENFGRRVCGKNCCRENFFRIENCGGFCAEACGGRSENFGYGRDCGRNGREARFDGDEERHSRDKNTFREIRRSSCLAVRSARKCGRDILFAKNRGDARRRFAGTLR